MRFITMHKADADTEAGVLPSPELMAGMGELMGKMAQAGVFDGGEGLRASSLGVRAVYSGGERTLTRGPFTPGNELPAFITLVSVVGLDAALPWADRFARILGDVEIDIRPICEPCHLGFAPAPPPGTPERFMLQVKATAQSEAGNTTPEQVRLLKALHADMRQAGVFAGAESIRPSSEGLRINYTNGTQARVIDGPFTESKELIAGYCIMRAQDRAEVLEWCGQFARCFPKVEVDIRPLDEPAV
jgi:hypothetical protein